MEKHQVTVFAQRWVATTVEVEAPSVDEAEYKALRQVQSDPSSYTFAETDEAEILSHAEAIVDDDEDDDVDDLFDASEL